MTALRADESLRDYENALAAVTRPDYRARLIDVITQAADDIKAGNADVVLLAARRMACIYLLLDSAQPIDIPEGRVVSDRFLQLADPAEWAGKRVILLDDTTVTGDTIRERAVNAERLVGPTGHVDPRPAITINSSGDEERDADAKQRDADEHYELHNQFTRAFGGGLLPFFTDFPVTEALGTDGAMLDRILSHGGWRTADVTNAVLSDSAARAYSLFPRDNVMDDFIAGLGDMARLIEIVKVRLYTHDDGTTVRLRFVPIVITRPITEESMRKWIGEMGLPSNDSANQPAQALGLLSFMLSRLLLERLAQVIKTDFSLDIAEDHQLTRIMIGQRLDGVPLSTYVDSLALLQAQADAMPGATRPVFAWPDGHPDAEFHYVIPGDDVARPGYECLQEMQEKVGSPREPGWEKNATTITSIAERAQSNPLTASLALDILNDLGFAIPASLSHDGFVFRGYRAGEVALRDLDLLHASPHGGVLAAFPRTQEISDDDYFGDDSLLMGVDSADEIA